MKLIISEQYFCTKFVVFENDGAFLKPVLTLDTTDDVGTVIEKIINIPDIKEITFLGNLGIFKKIEQYYKENHAEVTIIWQ